MRTSANAQEPIDAAEGTTKGPAASVAMATYNGECFLEEQLESLARQTLLPYELVACDDGSTDSTLGILHDFAARAPFPVRIYRNEMRLGYGPNFLRAASLCSGSLIAFCDQDDVWLDQKLKRCAAVMANPENSLVIHSAEVVNENLESTGVQTLRVRRSVRLDAAVGRGWNPLGQRLSEALDWVRGCTCVFRSRLLSQIPPAPPLAGPGKAHEIWLQFASEVAGSIILLPEVLALYRQHEQNAVGFKTSTGSVNRFVPSPNIGEAEFLLWAKSASNFAGFLAEAASRPSEVRERVARARCWYDTRARCLAQRASLYGQSRPLSEGVRHLASMVLGGAYKSTSQGGLGPRGLARDILMSLLRRTLNGRREGRQRPAEGLAGPQQTAPDRQLP